MCVLTGRLLLEQVEVFGFERPPETVRSKHHADLFLLVSEIIVTSLAALSYSTECRFDGIQIS